MIEIIEKFPQEGNINKEYIGAFIDIYVKSPFYKPSEIYLRKELLYLYKIFNDKTPEENLTVWLEESYKPFWRIINGYLRSTEDACLKCTMIWMVKMFYNQIHEDTIRFLGNADPIENLPIYIDTKNQMGQIPIPTFNRIYSLIKAYYTSDPYSPGLLWDSYPCVILHAILVSAGLKASQIKFMYKIPTRVYIVPEDNSICECVGDQCHYF